MNRRTFLETTALAAGAVHALGANDRVNVAVIGLRSRGRDHIVNLAQVPGTRISAICDIDQAQAERGARLVEEKQGTQPKQYSDLRKLFDDKDVDAVTIATCNHWHALASIWACQAGKDVYVEKPACHNLFEGRKMVEAARKYKRMVQVGMQSRTTAHKIEAVRLLREGSIGKLYMAKSLCYKRRKSIGHQADAPVPPGVDYNLWLGPAPQRPFNPNRFHYNWHWFWDTGNGDIGNQGVHEIDIARWGMGLNTLPKRVVSTGGKYVYSDDQETPNTQIASFQWDDCEIVTEVRGLLTNSEASIGYSDGGFPIGNIFFGSDGYMSMSAAGCRIYKGEKYDMVRELKPQEEIWATKPHIANFLGAVRSRKREQLTCDIEEGRLSTALVHLANTSYRLGRSLHFDPAADNYGSDTEANRYVSRNYRKPFVVPEKV
jgi:predicted dehydrogenase